MWAPISAMNCAAPSPAIRRQGQKFDMLEDDRFTPRQHNQPGKVGNLRQQGGGGVNGAFLTRAVQAVFEAFYYAVPQGFDRQEPIDKEAIALGCWNPSGRGMG